MSMLQAGPIPMLLVLLACGGQRPLESTARGGHAPEDASSRAAEAPRAADEPLGDLLPLDTSSCVPTAPSSSNAATSPDGSTVALVQSAGRTLAYVADADARAIHTIDVDTATRVGSTPVSGAPRQLVVLPDGRVVSAIESSRRLEVLVPIPGGGLARRCTRLVGVAPWGLAWDRAGARLVVTDGSRAVLSIVDTDSMSVGRTVTLPKAPRSVIVRDGTAFVSHLSGNTLSVVELESEQAATKIDLASIKASPHTTTAELGTRRSASQGFALASVDLRGSGAPSRRILAPNVSVDPGDASRPSETYYGDPPGAVPKQAPHVVGIDAASRTVVNRFVLDPSRTAFVGECLLPRAATVHTGTQGLFVACMGVDQVLELDARASDPMLAVRRRFDVPAGPTGLALDEAAHRMVVWSQLDSELTIVPLDTPKDRRAVAVPRPSVDPKWELGRRFFFATDDVRVTNDGLTCASCHPDGLEDGLTWRTPEGPRQTPMLAGRLVGTEPFGWSRDQADLTSYVSDTVGRLGGRGLDDFEVQAIALYVESLGAPPSWAGDPTEIAAGRAIFEAAKTDCATCHPDGGTDGRAHLLNLQSKETLDTPSLRSVGLTAPYFHDGRYGTLDALLSDPKSHMGRAHELDPADRRRLKAYLDTL